MVGRNTAEGDLRDSQTGDPVDRTGTVRMDPMPLGTATAILAGDPRNPTGDPAAEVPDARMENALNHPAAVQGKQIDRSHLRWNN